MKAKLIMIAALIAMGFTATAVKPEKVKSFSSLRSLVSHRIHYPGFLETSQPLEVRVDYRVNRQGIIRVTNISHDDEALRDYIMKRINGTKVYDDTLSDSEGYFMLKFGKQ